MDGVEDNETNPIEARLAADITPRQYWTALELLLQVAVPQAVCAISR